MGGPVGIAIHPHQTLATAQRAQALGQRRQQADDALRRLYQLHLDAARIRNLHGLSHCRQGADKQQACRDTGRQALGDRFHACGPFSASGKPAHISVTLSQCAAAC